MRNLLLAFSCWLLAVTAVAKDVPARPQPARLVNDYANALQPQEREALERKLDTYFDSTSTQIAVVIENSLEGDDLFDYSQRLATAWGIGEKGKNNGILIYVAISDRKARIHTGYGMEATITDALTTRIRQQYMNPNFKKGNYYEGLDEATDVIIRAAAGEYQNERQPEGRGRFPKILIPLIVIVVLIVIFRRRGGGGRGGRGGGWMAPVFWGTFGSGGFSSGSGFGGGGGGSSFGGFGGGSFGGGGSGGSW